MANMLSVTISFSSSKVSLHAQPPIKMATHSLLDSPAKSTNNFTSYVSYSVSQKAFLVSIITLQPPSHNRWLNEHVTSSKNYVLQSYTVAWFVMHLQKYTNTYGNQVCLSYNPPISDVLLVLLMCLQCLPFRLTRTDLRGKVSIYI